MTPARAAALAEKSNRIYIGGCASEPAAVLDAVAADPALWSGKTLTGAFIPGVNQRDFSALGRDTRVETIFMTAGLMPGTALGTVEHLPLHYSEYWRRLAEPGFVDIAYVQVPPPRSDGTVGLGPTADFVGAPIGAGAKLVGIINPAMRDAKAGPRYPAERFSAFTEADHALIDYDAGAVDGATAAIAQHILSVLGPGDTIQLGLGKVQAAVLGAIATSGMRNLGFHGGMISSPFRDAWEEGVFKEATTGVALGGAAFYDWVGAAEALRFAEVGYTHNAAVLAAIDRFVSINSVIEVDLLGQANGESLRGKQISGQGGMVDFVRGARSSSGGRSILALSSTASGGRVSRIVPEFSPGTPVSVARADVDMIITEYGIARLRHASPTSRAEQLIAIAAPQFRDELGSAWERLQA